MREITDPLEALKIYEKNERDLIGTEVSDLLDLRKETRHTEILEEAHAEPLEGRAKALHSRCSQTT